LCSLVDLQLLLLLLLLLLLVLLLVLLLFVIDAVVAATLERERASVLMHLNGEKGGGLGKE